MGILSAQGSKSYHPRDEKEFTPLEPILAEMIWDLLIGIWQCFQKKRFQEERRSKEQTVCD